DSQASHVALGCTMPAVSLERWRTERLAALDELQVAHRSVGGTGRGRRPTTQQINHAYAVLLSSQFQGFCRDLHNECIGLLVRWITLIGLRDAFERVLLLNRKLDTGNPNPGNIGSDFDR